MERDARTIAVSDAAVARPSLPRLSAQTIAGMAMAAIVGVLVLYPIFFLLQAALDVGDPDVRPPTAYGLGNFVAMWHYAAILGNTLVVSAAATAMAIIFGFVTAWILSRTDVPFRRTLEQLMAVPYYVTPLLGALAWSMLGAPESGFINQFWHALGGQRRADRHGHAVRHRLGDGAVRGLGRLLHDWRGDEIDGPVTGGSLPGDGRQPPAHHAARHAATGRPRRAGRDDLCVRRDARLLHRGIGAGVAQPLLRGDHGDLPARFAIPATPAIGRRHGRIPFRRDVRDDADLSTHRHLAQLRYRHREGVSAAPDGYGRTGAGSCSESARSTCCCPLCCRC